MELDALHTLINTSNIQVNPHINLVNIIVKNIMDITLEPHVRPHMTINVSAPQVVH